MPPKEPLRLPLNKPPGRWHLVVTLASLAVLVSAWCRWWPRAEVDAFLAGAGAGLVLLVCGAWWAIRSVYVTGQDRRWSWWIAAAPAAVALAAGVAWWGRPDFGQARPQMERVAAQLRADPGPTSRWGVGLERFDIAYARDDGEGTVFFVEPGGYSLGPDWGWMHAPSGVADRRGFAVLDPLGGGWYRFETAWD